MIETVRNLLSDLTTHVFSAGFVYSPVYLVATVVIAFIIWRARGGRTGFIRYLLPKELYRHPSTMLDIKITLFNFLIMATGIFSVLYVAPVITFWALNALGGLGSTQTPIETGLMRGLAVALIIFLTQDFCRFLNHYLHHKHPALWPFHAVHHSAEVLTPITYMRAHPVYYVIQRLMMSVLIGLIQALVLFLLVGQIEFWVIYSSTLAFSAYIFFGGHLRHSHIRLSYGRVLEHILISPAQHQIHHSSDRAHFDKNFGEVFAIWDWMFGTLHIPDGKEELVYGISDAAGRRIAQPYPTLRAALLKPFSESATAWRGNDPYAKTADATDDPAT